MTSEVRRQDLVGSQTPRLRTIAIELGIRGVYKLHHGQLVDAILKKQEEEEKDGPSGE